MTQAQLISLLEIQSHRGAFPCTLTTIVEPKMRKTGNPRHGNCWKVSRVNVMANFIYGNAVNRQRVREGTDPDFQAQPRKWGERLPGTCFVAHKDKLYVEAKVERSLGRQYVDRDGKPIDAEAIAPFLPDRDGEGETQEIESVVIVRDYSLESIVGIVLAGQSFDVDPADPAKASILASSPARRLCSAS